MFSGINVASFDSQEFKEDSVRELIIAPMLAKILCGLPKSLAEQFSAALARTPFQAAAGLAIELDLTATLGDETQGQSETFIPLVIKNIHASRFNPDEVPNDPNDMPPDVFKLRDAFVIQKEK